MSFVLGYVVNEGGILYINDVPHSSGRGVGRLSRMDFEISGRSRANALGIDYISVGVIAVTAAVTWYRGIRETFNSFDSNATDNFDRYYRDLEDGQRLLKLLYLKVSLIMDQALATIGNRNFGNYWFYLGPAEILLWFMVEKTLIHLLLYYPPIRQLTYH
jgi:hypothetical protein